ncbi:MAG: NAD(P)/FAD-dependent oxidoreductase [Nakamurella sp.]
MRALIVGGGIAGPATALALQQRGIEAVVLERRAADSGGSWITVSPNGLDALDLLGVLPQVRAVGVPSIANVMLGATGRTLGRIALGRARPDGLTALTVRRSEVAAVLRAAAVAAGAEIRDGATVVDIIDGDGGATVALADGSTVTGDLIIGADGVRSVIRSWIDPDGAPARYVGLTNFGGISRSTPLAAELEPAAWQFIFGRGAFFGAHPTPEGDVVWFVNVPRDPISRAERASTTDEQWRAGLLDKVAGDAGPARELIRTGELELVGDNTFDLRHVTRWWRERAIVIGDAAHAPSPSSGQGASMALEDAVVLARSLVAHDEPAAAFAAYEQQRRARVERIVKAGARSSSAKIPGRLARPLTEAMLRVVFRFVVTERGTEWMTGHRLEREAQG